LVTPELRLGNLLQDDFKRLTGNSRYVDFGRCKKPASAECASCRWLPLCMGDCCKNRRPGGCSHLCRGWQIFYEHTIQRFEILADRCRAQLLSGNPNAR
jgi:uncharacterized protein